MMTTSTTDRFLAHYSGWLRWIFYSQVRWRNFDTGWILCHISVVFFAILFKPQKRTPTLFIPSTCQVLTHSYKRFTL